MLHIFGIISAMMALSFGIGMAVAFAIKKTTAAIDHMNRRVGETEEILRAKHIKSIAKRERRRIKTAYEQKCKVSLINHYYGNNYQDPQSSESELLNHFYPKHH
jgi:hypothetical protein